MSAGDGLVHYYVGRKYRSARFKPICTKEWAVDEALREKEERYKSYGRTHLDSGYKPTHFTTSIRLVTCPECIGALIKIREDEIALLNGKLESKTAALLTPAPGARDNAD